MDIIHQLRGGFQSQHSVIDKKNKEIQGLKLRIMQLERMLIKRDMPEAILPEKIIYDAVNYFYECPFEAMCTNSRLRLITFPRQINMYFMCKYSQYSLSKIGSVYGNRHYSTVIHSRDCIEGYISIDNKFKKRMEDIDSMINTQLREVVYK